MISVLIPTYNYSVIPLVEELHKQLEASKCIYEIIVWDDGSSETFDLQNRIINHVPNIHYFRSEEHLGSTKTRQLLYKKSVFNWLLFIDADVMPKSPEFIKTYLNLIPKDYDAIFGGYTYGKVAPKDDMVLQWKYGISKEKTHGNIANSNSYKVIVSSNFMIKRSVFTAINPNIEKLGFGFDNYFGTLLKENKAKVFHIHNEVYHLGITSNERFLEKTKLAISNLLDLYQDRKINIHDNSLLNTFIRLKTMGMSGIYSLIYKKLRLKMERHLCGKNPSLRLFKFYKITYMCFKSRNGQL